MKKDGRKNNGGARPNSGPKNILPDVEKKVTLIFYVKSKNKDAAKKKIQPIIDRFNK